MGINKRQNFQIYGKTISIGMMQGARNVPENTRK
jgi:hypothetical protein